MRRLLTGVVLAAALSACGSRAATEPSSSVGEAAPYHVTPGVALRPKPIPAVRPTTFDLFGVRADVVPVVPVGTTLTPPSDPLELGWWGRKAGSKQGVTLLIGHTVHTGHGGALDHLNRVPVGTIGRVSGVRYQVIRNVPMSKKVLAVRSPHLFSQTGRPLLVVVTCLLSSYDPATGEYAKNDVLIARPL